MPRRQSSLVDEISQGSQDNPTIGLAVSALLAACGAGFIYLWPRSELDFGIATFAGIFLLFLSATAALAALVGLAKQALRNKRLDSTISIEHVRNLTWRQFEQLVADAYRRLGYKVEEGPGTNDGGIDLRLLSPTGQYHPVQCKRWKSYKVGVKELREFYGAMAADKRPGQGIFICCGDYTAEARKYAAEVGITLVDKVGLLHLLKSVNDKVELRPESDSSR